jgi:hypothetical protein
MESGGIEGHWTNEMVFISDIATKQFLFRVLSKENL